MWNPRKLLFNYLNSIYVAKAVNMGIRFYSEIYSTKSYGDIEKEINIVFGKDYIWSELLNQWYEEQKIKVYGEMAEYLAGSKIVYKEGNFSPTFIKNGEKITKKMFVKKFMKEGFSMEYLKLYYDTYYKNIDKI